ncbi:DJ-1/PfpI family protein [Vibrio rumoiensis]|uniref:Glutamine amidotransferase n=1 Tax=Vibrio rumoiensis 1S-45 TaxID=1188252 RepID=A0A1E5E125_9VIBR|nr:DJ-1/PfpI family protein [Vibrio rumoiensis]OEF24266.1 glutamine amidotransferase [Vibrio rumoiensis 1S-45]
MKIGIYIYDNAEVLDFSGPYEVFTTANRINHNDTLFETFLIAERNDIVTARAGYQVLPHFDITNHPELDVLIIVGGVHTNEMTKHNVIHWISEQQKTVPLIASVCTGAFLLAQAQVFTHHKVTTHWEDIPSLRQLFPSLDVQENVRWVQDGNKISSGGISAGIDMSLFIVSQLANVALAEATAKQMEFRWVKND